MTVREVVEARCSTSRLGPISGVRQSGPWVEDLEAMVTLVAALAMLRPKAKL